MYLLYMEQKALLLGGLNLKKSSRKNKRFMITYNDILIHFGDPNAITYYDKKDDIKRKAYIARHSKIKNKNNKYVINLKTSPSYWSARLLWNY